MFREPQHDTRYYLGDPAANALSAHFTATFSLRFAYLALKVIFSKLSKPPFTARLYKLAALRTGEASQARSLARRCCTSRGFTTMTAGLVLSVKHRRKLFHRADVVAADPDVVEDKDVGLQRCIDTSD